MKDTISRQAAVYAVDEMCYAFNVKTNAHMAFIKALADLPSAERRGRWIEEYSANHFQAKCSACGESTLYGITYDLEGNAYYMNYCPYCGAKMEEGGE